MFEGVDAAQKGMLWLAVVLSVGNVAVLAWCVVRIINTLCDRREPGRYEKRLTEIESKMDALLEKLGVEPEQQDTVEPQRAQALKLKQN